MAERAGRFTVKSMDATSPELLTYRVPLGVRTIVVWLTVLAFAVMSLVALPDGATRAFPHGVAGFALVMALPVGLIRRWPLPVLVLLLAEAVTFAEHGAQQIALLQFLAADVVVCFTASTRSRRTSIVSAATCVGVLAGYSAAPEVAGHASLSTAPAPLIVLALTVVIAWTTGNSIRQRHHFADTLHMQTLAQAVMAERLRIARDLHDMVAHSIGVIAFQAGAASRVIDSQPAEARNALNAIETTSRETLTGLRRMLGALRETETDPPETRLTAGLGDLARLTATAKDAGVDVDVAWRGLKRALPPDVDLSAFRIIQEAVTNVVRHAGTSNCQVAVDYCNGEQLTIEVIDDGPGCTTAGTGYGIAGMRERVGLLHGHFAAGPRPQGGFRVAARLPL
jgi:signal transduction histidine kinase